MPPQVVDATANGLPGDGTIELICSVYSWLFVKVMVCVALVVLTGTLPKLNAIADRVYGGTPTPLSATICGLLLALVETIRLPDCSPNIEVAMLTPMMHVAPGAIEPTHVVDAGFVLTVNGLPGEIVSEVSCRGMSWLFLRETIKVALVSLIGTLPKFNHVGHIAGSLATAKFVVVELDRKYVAPP